MGAFGDRMRREREMRGVTLEEISESTKISKRALQALEKEEFDLLPGGIFNKGFVRAYARYLGIDEEQAVADFVAADAANHEAAEENKFPLNVEDRPAQPPLNPKRSITPVILALILLAIVAGGWTYWNKHKSQPAAHVDDEPQGSTTSELPKKPLEQSPSLQPLPANGNPVDKAADPNEKTDSTGQEQKTDTSDISGSDRSSNPDSVTSTSTDSTLKQSSPPNVSSDSTFRNRQPFTVSIKATEDSWISIVADGKPPVEYTLSAEKQKSVTAGKELVLVTGNAGGIEVRYNGKPIEPLGKEPRKQTLIFTPQGMKRTR